MDTRKGYVQVWECQSLKLIKKLLALSLAFSLLFWNITPYTFAETITTDGGTIDINTQDNVTTWNVTGNPVWNVPTFNLAEGNTLNMTGLTNGASLALLVNGGSSSNVFGTMNINNLAFILQNVYGINIGQTGLVNLSNASMIASTLPLNLNSTNFLTRDYKIGRAHV